MSSVTQLDQLTESVQVTPEQRHKFLRALLKIVHLVHMQNFPKNYHFLVPDKNTENFVRS